MKKTLKIAVSMALALMMLITPSLAIIAPEDAAPIIPEISDEALFIPLDTAREVALLFLDDIMNTGMTEWNEQTAVTNVVTLYDQFGGVNAYSVELTTGYVVVAAYMDVPNVILEWSDISEPLYEQFEVEDTDRIVCLGALEYYLDYGSDNLLRLSDDEVLRWECNNAIKALRSIEHITPSKMNAILNKEEMLSAPNATIPDPFEYATEVYGGTFVANDYCNLWEPYIDCRKATDFSDTNGETYYQHCGPTAILTILTAYASKNNLYGILSYFDEELFSIIADIGIQNGYYNNSSCSGGTPMNTTNYFIEQCFNYFDESVGIRGTFLPTYSNIKNPLMSGSLLYLASIYSGVMHATVAYAYTRLVNSNNTYVTFLKVADGWAYSPRYIDLSSIDYSSASYWEVYFYNG